MILARHLTHINQASMNSQITYIGHASILIEMDGVRLLTDPILRNWVWHLRRRTRKIDPGWYQNIDAVLISHSHWDHLHLPSLKLLDKNTLLIVPSGVIPILNKEGFNNVEEITAGETISIGPVSVKATYADHDSARFRMESSIECLGYIISGQYNIYFPGDTDIFDDMANLCDSLDLALMPVWGWGPTLGSGHMNPERAAESLQLLNPRLAIPIHWGTFFPFGMGWMMPKLLIDPPHLFTLFAAKLAPAVKTKIMPPGSQILLEDELQE